MSLGLSATAPASMKKVFSHSLGRPSRSEWENTFFIDAGAVADSPKDMKPSVGIGTGVRWRSPIGPLQIDLAYGVKPKQLRLHVSVGFVF